MWLLLIWTAVLAAALYLYMQQVYSFFKKRGVKTEKPVPFFGTMIRIILRQEHLVHNLQRCYRSFPEERFVGRYEMTRPTVLIRDLELVKKITIKDSEHFLDHSQFFRESDPIFGKNLLSLTGQDWKDMRSTLSPAFTSSKMRLMLPFMVEVGDNMVASLVEKIKNGDSAYLDVDVKDLTTRFANDVIASCAFGLKVDSHTDRDNQFYEQGLIASSFKFKQLVLVFLINAFPAIMNRLKIPLFSKQTTAFFSELILNTMKYRESRNIFRPDMIHLLMEAKKGKLNHDDKTIDTDTGFATVEESSVGKKKVDRVWADDVLIAQPLLFFVAGFETTSSAMAFLLYELAVNPDVQDRLAEEIRETDAKNGGKFDYTSIQDMKYMDMVVSEALRLWPPASALDRQCVKDYNLGKPNDKASKDYIIRNGDGLLISAWAIHRDPKYFPNPNKFDPERFSEENKHNIVPCSYAPFGLGPRNCMGSRFALCDMKVMTYKLLLNMEISPGPKTCIPAELETDTFNLRMKGGHWLRFKVRSRS